MPEPRPPPSPILEGEEVRNGDHGDACTTLKMVSDPSDSFLFDENTPPRGGGDNRQLWMAGLSAASNPAAFQAAFLVEKQPSSTCDARGGNSQTPSPSVTLIRQLDLQRSSLSVWSETETGRGGAFNLPPP